MSSLTYINRDDAAYRYWRVLNESSENGSLILFTEVEMHTTVGGSDVCSGGTAIGTAGSGGSSEDPDKAFDNNTGTFWQGAWSGGTHAWIGYDFGAGNDKAIVEVAITPGGGGFNLRTPSTVRIQASTNGTTWVDVWFVRSGPSGNWGGGTTRTFTKPTTAPPSRYWAIWCITPGSPSTAISCAELEWWETGVKVNSTGGGFSSSSLGGFPVTNAYDGNTATFWHCSSDSELPWLGYDFGSGNDKTIDEVKWTSRSGFGSQSPTLAYICYGDDTVSFVPVFLINDATAWGSLEQRDFIGSYPASGPTIISIAPTQGTTAGGTAVTVTGTGFTGATDLKFDGVSATLIVVVDDSHITCVTPSHAVGAVDVEVFTPAGNDTAVGLFTYILIEIRVTQSPLLVLDLSAQPTRVTQLPIHVIYTSLQPTRVTQVPELVLYEPKVVPLPEPVVPEVPVKEVWQYKTVVTVAQKGKEQRSALRDQPRINMSFNALILDDEDRRDIYNMLFKFLPIPFLYPQYVYTTRLTASAVAGATKLFFNPAATDLRDGEALALFDPQLDKTYYIDILTMDIDGADLLFPLEFDVPASWYVSSSNTWRLTQSVGFSMSSMSGKLQVSMQSMNVRDPQRPGSVPGLTMLGGKLLLDKRPLADNDVDEGFDQSVEWLDNLIAPPEPKVNYQTPFIDGDRRFLAHRNNGDLDYWTGVAGELKGRLKSFLMPTFRDDLPLVGVPALGAIIMVTSNLQYFTFWLAPTYRYIRIETANGAIYRRILNATANYDDDGDPESINLTIDSALGASAGDNIISKISYVNICRLDSDEIALTHYEVDTYIDIKVRTVNE